MTVEAILLRRAILDWQDQCLFDAEITLMRLLRDIEPLLTEELDKASFWTLSARPADYCRKVADPLMARSLGPTLLGLQERSRAGLLAVRAEPFAVHLIETKSVGKRAVWATAFDLGTAGVPVAVGIWGLLAASTASIGSVAVFMGLGAAATVSMPVLVGGAAVATLASSFGLVRLTGIKKRGQRRIERQIRASVSVALLGDGTEGPQSVLSAYASEVERVTMTVLREAESGSELSI